ncbi:MAG: GAF domain-containing sensor histidine kinase, partial [Candidatus Omnitrophica bacterium]|nr:GAF domain-containing sensor histidine kinase [Candidatus Omnitrophota bacterium]
ALLIKASMGLTNIRELKRLLGVIVAFITKTLHTKNAAIYLFDKEEQVYKLESVRYRAIFHGITPLEPKDPLIKMLKETREPLVLEEIKAGPVDVETNEIIAQMKNLSSAVIIPSFIEETLLGFLALAEKKSGDVYTRNDLEVLSVLSNQAALAIENAIFYEEQGKTLAQQFQEHRLRSLGKMGSGIGHQINNRFNAISVIASVCQALDLEDLKKTELRPEQKVLIEKIEDAFKKVIAEALRGGNIAKNLTQFSRLQQDFRTVNLDEVFQGTLNLLSCKFNPQEINLSLDYPTDNACVWGNIALLQDVFFNLLDNARDACFLKQEKIKEGIFDLNSYQPKVSIRVQRKDNFYHIEVEDNGIGMSEDELEQLFIPFFTTKATSQKGTGLGLSIIKKIIDAHKGTIRVASQYGNGTTFTITLPIANC